MGTVTSLDRRPKIAPVQTLRRPPAFQSYASDLLANEAYHTLNSAERGVYHSICLACWVNDSVPADGLALSRAVRLERKDIEDHLPRVIEANLVTPHPDDKSRLYVVELADQMAQLLARRAQQVAAGSKGGRVTQANARRAPDSAESPSDSLSDRSSVLSRSETKGKEQSGRDGRREVVNPTLSASQQEWANDYQAAEKVTNGSDL